MRQRDKGESVICMHLLYVLHSKKGGRKYIVFQVVFFNLSGHIKKFLEHYLASGLCLTEQAKSKHRSTPSWKQSLWSDALRLHHHGPVVKIFRFSNQSASSWGRFVCGLGQAFDIGWVVYLNCQVPSHFHHFNIFIWIDEPLVVKWTSAEVTCLLSLTTPFFLLGGADVWLKAGTEALAASFRE